MRLFELSREYKMWSAFRLHFVKFFSRDVKIGNRLLTTLPLKERGESILELFFCDIYKNQNVLMKAQTLIIVNMVYF